MVLHRDLGSLPMRRLVEPAMRHAREGVTLNAMQAAIMNKVLEYDYWELPKRNQHFSRP